ncbi:hypothetical protein [Bermanella sp. R86510]|uniref:hypothetical protein n=1 Tax=unclassified Bermanella TaxID=2627862 RepID=UPI0037CB8A13
MQILKKLILLGLIVTLSACLESDDDDAPEESIEEEGVGFFIDSPVQGLSYSSPSYSGTTDAFGRFDYESGETVTFSLGSIVLGSASTAKAIHVSDLFGDEDATDTRTINLARLLLTLDSDADSDNGIQLSAAAISEANSTTFANGIDFSSVDFDSDVANYIGSEGVAGSASLVSVSAAEEHITETLSEVEGLLADCGNECVPRAAFNEYVEGLTPRHAQTGVSTSLDTILLDMTDDYDDTGSLLVEFHGLPSSGYDNCRIDWPGFRCESISADDLSSLYDMDVYQTINSQEVTFNVNDEENTLTVTLSASKSLKANYQYTIHVFNDGESGDQDDYKTWWQFKTGGAAPTQ